MKVWRSLSFTAHLPHELLESVVHVSRQVPISVSPWSHLEESYNLNSVYPSQRFLLKVNLQFSSVQSFGHVQLFATPWTAALRVHRQLPEFTQTHVHWVSDAIQPSHPLSSPSPTFDLSHHQGLFQWVNTSHEVAKLLEFQPQHQSFQWTPRTDLL